MKAATGTEELLRGSIVATLLSQAQEIPALNSGGFEGRGVNRFAEPLNLGI